MSKEWKDNRLKGKSGSGIMIDGMTLEEYIDLEESVEVISDQERASQADKRTIYRSPSPKYPDQKGRSGKARSLPQSTINQDYHKEILMSYVERGKSLKELVLSVLISGTQRNNKEIANKINTLIAVDRGKPTTSGSIAGVMSSLYRSALGTNFLMRGLSAEPKSKKETYVYHLNKYGRELTIDQLFRIATNRDPLTQFNIKEQVSRLVTLGFEPVEITWPDKEQEAVRKEHMFPRKPAKKGSISTAEIKNAVKKAKELRDVEADEESPIRLAIPKDININVNFTFSFKWVKD